MQTCLTEGDAMLPRIVLAAKFFFCVTAAVCFSAAGGARAGDLEFPNEARRRWAEYMELAKHIQGSSSHVSTDRLTHKVRAREGLELKIRGFAMAYSFQSLGPNEHRQEYYVRNEKYGFQLRRKASADGWALVQLFPKIGDGKNLSRLSLFLGEGTTRTFAPLAIYNSHWLPEMVEEKEFLIKKYITVAKDGSNLARVEFEYTKAEKNRHVPSSGWFELDPALYWVVRGYHVKITAPSAVGGYSGTASYSAEFKIGRSGIPLLTKSSERIDCPAEKTNSEWTNEYSLDEHEPAAEEFTLTAFGLPEPHGVIWPKPTPYYLWFIGVGLASLVLGVFLRRWLQKKAATRASSISPGAK